MKSKILFLLVITISAVAPIAGQTDTQLQRVTLYFFKHPELPDESRSSINFETGKRGYTRGEPYTDFDLQYGGMAIGMNGRWIWNWLRVTDPRSMIADIGAKQWRDFKETPPFPPGPKVPPRSLSQPTFAVDASADSKVLSPYRQFVEVKPEHMYLMRLRHGNKVRYVMFRVESLTTKDNCVITWKMVIPPNVDNERDDLPREPLPPAKQRNDRPTR